MPGRPFVWACAGLFLVPAPSVLVAQSPPSGPDPRGGVLVSRPAPPPPVEVAAAAAGVPLFDPAPNVDGFAPWFLDAVDRVMVESLAEGAAPGAAVVVGHRGRIVLARGWGRTDPEGGTPATPETVWDLASVTKAAATTVAAMILAQDGALDLDARVHAYLPAWPREGERALVTVRDLLRHSSGLPAAAPVGRGGPDEVVARIAALSLRATPGDEERYGDLDMVLLGAVVEAVAGEPLDAFVARRVYRPLGMDHTAFRPLEAGLPLRDIAPTEVFRRTQLHGVVHDPIARDLDGVAGNAGLFSSALDLATLASALLWESPGRVVCRDVVREFTRPVPGSRFALGWTTAARGTMWGDLLSRSAFGHVGYTGTSLWIDPELDLFVVLLTNRVNPSSRNRKHLDLRYRLHAAVRRGLAEPGWTDAPGAGGWNPADGCRDERVAREMPAILGRVLPGVRVRF